jgi:hypothetical protein
MFVFLRLHDLFAISMKSFMYSHSSIFDWNPRARLTLHQAKLQLVLAISDIKSMKNLKKIFHSQKQSFPSEFAKLNEPRFFEKNIQRTIKRAESEYENRNIYAIAKRPENMAIRGQREKRVRARAIRTLLIFMYISSCGNDLLIDQR